MSDDTRTPILIVGGGAGGVAAALAITDLGQRCVLTEQTDWLGGQLTAQAVPPDENRWVEPGGDVQGVTASYQRFRETVRDWYRATGRLTDAATTDPRLNPGGGWVSRLCYEPAVGHAVIRDMLQPAIDRGLLKVRLNHHPVGADVKGDRVRSISFEDRGFGGVVTIAADVILDATEAGDLWPLVGAEHRVGSECRKRSGEMHAHDSPEDDPTDQQAITWVFALEHRPDEDHTIARPERYAHWRDFVPKLEPAWPGRLFDWTICGEGHRPRHLNMVPWPDEPADDSWELWRYRRVVNRAIYRNSYPPPDVTLINWVQNDYFAKPTLGVTEAEQQVAFAEAKEQSRCLLYWMQTEAPRHDGGVGYPGLKLHPKSMDTGEGFAKAPYIREPRRLEARYMLSEADLGADQRRAEGHPDVTPINTPRSASFADAVAIGHYPIDLHPSASGRNQLYVEACPFEIPLRALLPVRIENMIAAGKSLGVTHIANGATRLHPVEWAIGEAAGVTAALSSSDGQPTNSLFITERIGDLRERLQARGVPLSWPWKA